MTPCDRPFITLWTLSPLGVDFFYTTLYNTPLGVPYSIFFIIIM